jgi:hypothetical protein
MKQFTFFLSLVFILGTTQLKAQRFKAYLGLGFNLTEDYLTQSGNSQVGTRLGLNIGPGVSAVLNKRWEINLELLYSQNGYYVKIVQTPTIALNKITLHYLEVPLALTYRFNLRKSKKEHFYKRGISLGISYARLFEYKIIASNGIDLTNDIRFDRENTLLFNFAATSFFSESFALNGRGTLSTFGEWTLALRLLYYI